MKLNLFFLRSRFIYSRTVINQIKIGFLAKKFPAVAVGLNNDQGFGIVLKRGMFKYSPLR